MELSSSTVLAGEAARARPVVVGKLLREGCIGEASRQHARRQQLPFVFTIVTTHQIHMTGPFGTTAAKSEVNMGLAL